MKAEQFKLVWTYGPNNKDVTAFFDNKEDLLDLAYHLGDECITYYAYELRNNRMRLITS